MARDAGRIQRAGARRNGATASFPGEALRLRFVAGGVELPSEPAHDLAGTPSDAAIVPNRAEIDAESRAAGSLRPRELILDRRQQVLIDDQVDTGQRHRARHG